ncbi:IS1182 family transposase [Beggiatoa alba]|nr:IS1182 family transposase [Beggiatoa alba]
MTRRYKAPHSRSQGQLFPAHMDDYISENNLVRALDAYVNHLNLSKLGYENTEENKTQRGHPAYSPAALLKLYLYGYVNRVTSSRRLEKECQRNLEVLWLMQGLKPSYKTISDFRSQNKQAIRATHKEFILFCKQLNLFGGECIAIDGSFFKGNVSKKSFITTKGLKRDIERLERHIQEWQEQLDQQDKQEENLSDEDNDPELQKKLQKLADLQTRKADKQQALDTLKQAGKTQQSRTDATARLLNKGTQKVAGYNVQIVTDTKYHLIAADRVSCDANDLKQLFSMAALAKAVLGSDKLDALADSGYYSAIQISDCMANSITPYVPNPREYAAQKQARYSKDHFHYHATTDQYQCPAGKRLNKSGQPRQQQGQWIQCYRGSETQCKPCTLRDACITKKSNSREIWRSELAEVMEKHSQRMAAAPNRMRQRGASVEHPFGTLKIRAGWNHFLLRGQEKVTAEFSLMAMSYNFTRVLNILGMEAFMKALKALINIFVIKWTFIAHIRRYKSRVIFRLECAVA